MAWQKDLAKIATAGVLALGPTMLMAEGVPHLYPEMSSSEYAALIAKRGGHAWFRAKNSELTHILDIGKRNIDWVQAVNATRQPQDQLALSSPETTVAYPIDAPGTANPTLIQSRLAAVRERMPEVMQKVLFEESAPRELPSSTLGVDDKTFITLSREVDRTYQAASRWLLQEPYLEDYRSYSSLDIRGYYYLNREPNLRDRLQHWSTLPAADQERLGDYLIGLCHNDKKTKAACRGDLLAATDDEVLAYYDRYLPVGKKVWDAFFAIDNPRRDAIWIDADPHQFFLPFARPQRQDVQQWLVDNIEDEWRWQNWALRLDFKDNPAADMTHIVFEPGATPNVNEVGGSIITMDANRPLDEYLVRWTIRHEFGHVLGFPDCYIEFYDAEQGVMINYQIDIGNIMCSRRGHLQEAHVQELRRRYFKASAGGAMLSGS